MLFNKDILFIHFPKTGGMSTRLHLQYLLEPPIYSIGALNKDYPLYHVMPNDTAGKDRADIINLNGDKHWPIPGGMMAMRAMGIDPRGLKMIVVGIRNPYGTEVSRFAFQKKYFHIPKDMPFAEYVSSPDTWFYGDTYSIESYYVPPLPEQAGIVRVVRYESLQADLDALGLGMGVVPWENKSEHGPAAEYVTTPDIEAAIYRRYQWIFDNGYYPRITL